jgi:hypothetical protein
VTATGAPLPEIPSVHRQLAGTAFEGSSAVGFQTLVAVPACSVRRVHLPLRSAPKIAFSLEKEHTAKLFALCIEDTSCYNGSFSRLNMRIPSAASTRNSPTNKAAYRPCVRQALSTRSTWIHLVLSPFMCSTSFYLWRIKGVPTTMLRVSHALRQSSERGSQRSFQC